MEQNKVVTYYVIKDLATWTTHGCKQSVCERYEHAEEAMQQFRDYAQWQTVIEDKRIRDVRCLWQSSSDGYLPYLSRQGMSCR